MKGGRGTLERAYRESLERHGYRADPAQERAVARLDDLRLRLEHAHEAHRGWRSRLRRLGRPQPDPVRGMYLWGGVGRGKTFLMDLFRMQLRVPSRRDHFHHFMKHVHSRLRELKDRENPLVHVAAEIAADSRVLCLDELFVSDIADAMLLSGLFTALVDNGVTLVFTSNAPPSALYRDGLQRSRFLPAIALLERCCEVLGVDGALDYRLRLLEKAPLYLDSVEPAAEATLARRFEEIAGDPGEPASTVEIEGRDIACVRRCADVIWFEFDTICGGPRSADDYVELAQDFHTLFVSRVPVFDGTNDDPARRFIALVDASYDRDVKLVLSAAAPPERLYRGERLAFAFERTRSRLAEMQTHAYLARPHRP